MKLVAFIFTGSVSVSSEGGSLEEHENDSFDAEPPQVTNYSADQRSQTQTPIFFIEDQVWRCELEVKL